MLTECQKALFFQLIPILYTQKHTAINSMRWELIWLNNDDAYRFPEEKTWDGMIFITPINGRDELDID